MTEHCRKFYRENLIGVDVCLLRTACLVESLPRCVGALIRANRTF